LCNIPLPSDRITHTWRLVWKTTHSCYERWAVRRKPNRWKLARGKFLENTPKKSILWCRRGLACGIFGFFHGGDFAQILLLFIFAQGTVGPNRQPVFVREALCSGDERFASTTQLQIGK
jgi:hypothetical protein